MVEGTPLLRAQTSKGSRGFESLRLRHYPLKSLENLESIGKIPAKCFAVACHRMRRHAIRSFGFLSPALSVTLGHGRSGGPTCISVSWTRAEPRHQSQTRKAYNFTSGAAIIADKDWLKVSGKVLGYKLRHRPHGELK